MDLIDWKNAHEGEVALVLGLGRSISQLDGRLPSELPLLIGVNDIGRLLQPAYLVIANPPRMFNPPERWDFVASSKAKVFLARFDVDWRETLEATKHLDPCVFPVRHGHPDFSNPNCLPCHNTSPYIGVALAHHMGFKQIGLLGVDFTKDHFFMQTGEHQLAGNFQSIDQGFGELAEVLRREGTRLVNVSIASRLTSLERVDLDRWLREHHRNDQADSRSA